MIFTLAFRNLTRNLRRTVITGVAVVVGVGLFILGWGFIDGLDENIIRGQIDVVSGHVVLRPPGYPDDGMQTPVDELQPVPAALEASLSTYTHVERLLFDVRVVRGADSARARGVGLSPGDGQVFRRVDWSIEGEDGVLMGANLARLLGVKVGDEVVMQARTSAGAINALPVRVDGIVTSHNPMIDNGSVLMPMARAQELVQAPGPSLIALRLDHRDDAARVAAALDTQGWQVATWDAEVADLLQMNEIRRNAIRVMIFVIMGIAATGIANTVIMATYERVREIGTLAAMGMTPNQLRGLFLAEGAAMGLVSSALGGLLGGGATFYWSVHGIPIGTAAENAQVAFTTTLFTWFRWDVTLASVAAGTLVAVLASLYPADHAARLDPAQAVRAE